MSGRTGDVLAEKFADDGVFPNNVLPVLIYRGALSKADVSADAFEKMFEANGWPPQWRSGMFDYHHYHSTDHECLGVASGEARILLGGPGGREFEVAAGDVILIPAGVAHRRLSSSAEFLLVGAYPPGSDWDLLRGVLGERPDADENIADVPMPKSDPVGGKGGPLMALWS